MVKIAMNMELRCAQCGGMLGLVEQPSLGIMVVKCCPRCLVEGVRKKNCDDFNGHNFNRETGRYNVAARDDGIEVCRNGKIIFTSCGSGKNQSVDTLEEDSTDEGMPKKYWNAVDRLWEI